MFSGDHNKDSNPTKPTHSRICINPAVLLINANSIVEDNADDLNLIKWACIERQEAFRRRRLSKAHSLESLCLIRTDSDEWMNIQISE